jgi:hypothetical protein
VADYGQNEHDLDRRSERHAHPGSDERTSWQTADMSTRLVSFDWQSAATNTAGYLSVNGGGATLSVSPHHDQDRLTGLSVTVENNVPWLVLIAH